jgi:hypothetical protein
MKKILLRYTGFIPFIALFSCATAQNAGKHSSLNNPGSTPAYNKEVPTGEEAATVSISARATKDFAKTFKKAENVGWFTLKDGYLAQFKKDGITTKVYYNRRGNWLANVRSYFEENMPGNIRHLVRSHYYDYKINYVQEVTVEKTTVYLVKIEDNAFFKTIRIQDGEMDEYEVLKKKDPTP